MELRKDPLKNVWTVIAPERNARPGDFMLKDRLAFDTGADSCPFCPGNESATPYPLLKYDENGEWVLRVFPNKYPALKVETEYSKGACGLYGKISGTGAHEVLVHTRNHTLKMSEYSKDIFYRMFAAVIDRMSDLHKDIRIAYIYFFQNSGSGAGATLRHPHCQILALPVLPELIEKKINVSLDYFVRNRRCFCCDLIDQEENSERVVARNSNFIAFAPYASARPFELAVYPLFHAHSIVTLSGDLLRDLCDIMSLCFYKLGTVLDEPDYNLMLYTSPTISEINSFSARYGNLKDYYHWHLEILLC